MTKKGVKRIEIFPENYKGLKIDAALTGMSERELANKLISEGLSSQAKSILGDAPMIQTIASDAPKAPRPKKRFISNDPDALRIIKEMYGHASYGEIAKACGWPKATVGENIKRMREAGDL